MDERTADSIMNKMQQSQAAYAKGMEMIGLFSAATIGFVVALAPKTNDSNSPELLIALILLFISTITTIFWFMGKGYQYFLVAQQMMKNPNELASASEPWWVRLSKVLALSCFLTAYYFLLSSL